MMRVGHVCYLSDLFASPALRGRGIGRAPIHGVRAHAKAAGASLVYWQAQADNAAGRWPYDKLAEHHGFIVYTHEM